MGCSVTKISDHLSAEELTLWLVRYMTREGYTYNREEIRKHEVESFLSRARKHWGK